MCLPRCDICRPAIVAAGSGPAELERVLKHTVASNPHTPVELAVEIHGPNPGIYGIEQSGSVLPPKPLATQIWLPVTR